MGGYLASREVLTAADRRQTMPAGDIRQMCVSPDLIPVMDTCVRPFLLRFGRPFVVFSPSASETLSCWRPQSFCDPPTSPLCFVWGGVSPAESCVRGAPLCEYSLHTSRTRSTKERCVRPLATGNYWHCATAGHPDPYVKAHPCSVRRSPHEHSRARAPWARSRVYGRRSDRFAGRERHVQPAPLLLAAARQQTAGKRRGRARI